MSLRKSERPFNTKLRNPSAAAKSICARWHCQLRCFLFKTASPAKEEIKEINRIAKHFAPRGNHFLGAQRLLRLAELISLLRKSSYAKLGSTSVSAPVEGAHLH
ncbi:hypothetical protein CDAR_589051 [Caerostris darwini]|uniref:Uncharacterized protein n=1 Tax=Caerostris darwini TaxID=1538125 RepID=A0AAV4T6B8_9ARAC|nr:hypothetical protein CDAR_589051 [Caerostris darwini]